MTLRTTTPQPPPTPQLVTMKTIMQPTSTRLINSQLSNSTLSRYGVQTKNLKVVFSLIMFHRAIKLCYVLEN